MLHYVIWKSSTLPRIHLGRPDVIFEPSHKKKAFFMLLPLLATVESLVFEHHVWQRLERNIKPLIRTIPGEQNQIWPKTRPVKCSQQRGICLFRCFFSLKPSSNVWEVRVQKRIWEWVRVVRFHAETQTVHIDQRDSVSVRVGECVCLWGWACGWQGEWGDRCKSLSREVRVRISPPLPGPADEFTQSLWHRKKL